MTAEQFTALLSALALLFGATATLLVQINHLLSKLDQLHQQNLGRLNQLITTATDSNAKITEVQQSTNGHVSPSVESVN